MVIDNGRGRLRYNLFGASVLALSVASPAFADDGGAAATSGAVSSQSIPSGPAPAAQGVAIPGAALPGALAGVGPLPESGIPFGSWMLYPSIFVGGTYNSNVYQIGSNPVSAFGARITPNIEADLDTGLHKVTVYVNADAQLYPGSDPALGETASTISGRTGIAYMWSPTSDVVTRFTTDFTRLDGAFGSTLTTSAPIGSATSFVGAPTAVSVSGYRQFTDQTTINLSVEKSLGGPLFMRAGVGAQDLVYEQAPIGIVGAQSSWDYTAFARGGYWVTPLVNAYVEVGGDLRRYYGSSFYDTNGYRAVLGFASDLIGLFRGQIYGGVQQQFSTQANFGDATAPAFGGSLTYYPTEYFTIALSADNFFSAAGAFGPNAVQSANNVTFEARLQADYAMFEYWKASVRGGFADTRYPGTGLSSEAWLGGAGLAYSFWRNYALTFDYQYTNTVSTGFGSGLSYAENLVTLGVTYRY